MSILILTLVRINLLFLRQYAKRFWSKNKLKITQKLVKNYPKISQKMEQKLIEGGRKLVFLEAFLEFSAAEMTLTTSTFFDIFNFHRPIRLKLN